MRALVTGATGFAGSHLAKALVADGYQVRVLAREAQRARALFGGAVEIAVGDIRDREDVHRAVDGCDQVFHLAALYRDAAAPTQAYWDVHVTGTEHVLAACAARRVERLIHCSTMGVHGHVRDIPGDEQSPFNPGDEYQRTKLIGEQRVWEFGRAHQLPFTVVRPAGIYGPGDARFLKLFKGIAKGYFVMLGRGETTYHFVYIDDLVQGFRLAARSPQALGEAFIIGGNRYVTLNELAALIAGLVHAPPPRWRLPVWPVYAAGAVCEVVCVPLRITPPLYRRRVDFFTHNRAFRIDKARRLLRYEPKVELEEGMRRLTQWFEAQGYLSRNGTVGEPR